MKRGNSIAPWSVGRSMLCMRNNSSTNNNKTRKKWILRFIYVISYYSLVWYEKVRIMASTLPPVLKKIHFLSFSLYSHGSMKYCVVIAIFIYMYKYIEFFFFSLFVFTSSALFVPCFVFSLIFVHIIRSIFRPICVWPLYFVKANSFHPLIPLTQYQHTHADVHKFSFICC